MFLDFTDNDENPQLLDDSSMFLLRFFLDVSFVMIRHINELKKMFGCVTSSMANKICSAVCDLKPMLDDELLDFIRKSNKNDVESSTATVDDDNQIENPKCWGDKIKYTLPAYDVPKQLLGELQNYNIQSQAAKNAVDTFSMRYDDVEKQNKLRKENQAKTAYNRAWLLQHVHSDLIESLISDLKSKKTNDELQNELIELLGFDKFDALQTLLDNRKEIAETIENEDKMQSRMVRVAVASQENGVSTRLRSKQAACVSSQVVVQSEAEMKLKKQVYKDEKKLRTLRNANDDEEDSDGENYIITDKHLNLHQQQQILDTIKKQPILSKSRKPSDSMSWLHQKQEKVTYPNVYDSQLDARSHVGFVAGNKLHLPESAKRIDNRMYEEINLPANKASDLKFGETRVKISDLDEIGQTAFKGIKELNRIQSIVFERAYYSNDNLLICAPTGAGKTNVAMLTILNTIRSFTDQGVIHRDQFKIIYVAPMKALAAEMVANFGKRLQPLGKSSFLLRLANSIILYQSL